jgi:hypothetical protein
VVAVLGAVVLVPLLLVAVLPVQRAETAARIEAVDIPGSVPVTPDLMDALDPSIHLTAKRVGNTVALRWHGGKPGTARVFYHVLRARHIEPNPPGYAGVEAPTIDGIWCAKSGAPHCATWMTELGRTRDTHFVDKPGPGRWSYRIQVAGNWRDDITGGDPVVYSNAVVAH